jgi:hypothetical protein
MSFTKAHTSLDTYLRRRSRGQAAMLMHVSCTPLAITFDGGVLPEGPGSDATTPGVLRSEVWCNFRHAAERFRRKLHRQRHRKNSGRRYASEGRGQHGRIATSMRVSLASWSLAQEITLRARALQTQPAMEGVLTG